MGAIDRANTFAPSPGPRACPTRTVPPPTKKTPLYIQYTYTPYMATTIKVTEETSGDLDALAARLFLKTRKKVTKLELVKLLAKLAGENEEALVAQILGRRKPIPDTAWRRLRRSMTDWGVDTSKEDLDEILYGEEG